MPVRKFRSVEAMNQVRWRMPGNPDLYEAIRTVWTAGLRQHGRRFPPGVYKYRSIDALDAQVQRWQQEHVGRLRRAQVRDVDPEP